MLLWMVIGLCLLGISAYAYWLKRWLDDAVVTIDRPARVIGEPLLVRVQQMVHRAATFKAIEVESLCERTTRYWLGFQLMTFTKRVWLSRQSALAGYEARAGEAVAVEFEFPLPLTALPTMRPRFWKRASVAWKLKQKTRLRGVPPYPDSFDILVKEEILDAEQLELATPDLAAGA